MDTTQNLTGVWNGLYSYADGLSVGFVATLIDGGSSLSGATHEPNVIRTTSAANLTALLDGGRRGRAVSLVKTYDVAGTETYLPVRYEGALNGEATEIEGRWFISDGNSGKFLMVRAQGKAVEVERRQRAKV